MAAVNSAITSITHNIPPFLRDPAVALIGERCYTVLVYDFNITNGGCLKYALSKGLGLGIVLGGSIVKIPQIIKIVSSKSARGLSLPAYVLETVSYAVSLAYASRNRFPFSTYGENFFLTIQNIIITLLIVYFAKNRGSQSGPGDAKGALLGTIITGAIGSFLWSEAMCPIGLLALLQALTLPISLLSKMPQILSNHKLKSTGNLSAFAVFNAFLGCLARLFTTKQEVNDPLIFWGFAGAAVLNAVLVAQMIMYWDAETLDSGNKKRQLTEEGLNSPYRHRSEERSPEGKTARKLD